PFHHHWLVAVLFGDLLPIDDTVNAVFNRIELRLNTHCLELCVEFDRLIVWHSFVLCPVNEKKRRQSLLNIGGSRRLTKDSSRFLAHICDAEKSGHSL